MADEPKRVFQTLDIYSANIICEGYSTFSSSYEVLDPGTSRLNSPTFAPLQNRAFASVHLTLTARTTSIRYVSYNT